MENEIENNNSYNNDIIVDSEEDLSSITALAYDDYYFQQIINKQDTIIGNQSNTYNLLNFGFTFISFILIIFFAYNYMKNLIRKQGI